MCVKNRRLALLFRAALVAGCGVGLGLNLGLFQGECKLSMLVFFTILSNLVCFFFFLALLVRTARDLRRAGARGATSFGPRLTGSVVLMITVTMLVYHLLLAPQLFTMDGGRPFSAGNFFVHTFTPLMTVLDWLLFSEKSAYRWFDPFVWLLIPYAYFGFALVRAECGGVIAATGSRYPYFFIDVDALGWGGVLGYVALITAAFVAIGYLFVLLDRVALKKRF